MAKQLTAENLVRLFSDTAVVEAITKALMPAVEAALERTFGARLRAAESSIIALTDKVTLFRERAFDAEARLDDIETQLKIDTLIVKGVPDGSYSDAATPVQDIHRTNITQSSNDTHIALETTLVQFCQNRLNVTIRPGDLSAVYRSKQGPKDSVRPIVVKFNNLRVRDEIYRAKKLLKREQTSLLSNRRCLFRNYLHYLLRV